MNNTCKECTEKLCGDCYHFIQNEGEEAFTSINSILKRLKEDPPKDDSLRDAIEEYLLDAIAGRRWCGGGGERIQFSEFVTTNSLCPEDRRPLFIRRELVIR